MPFINKNILKEIASDNIITTKIIDAISDFTFKPNYITTFTLNINSISAHFDELTVYLSSMKKNVDIIILTETWLLTDFNYILNGFVCIH